MTLGPCQGSTIPLWDPQTYMVKQYLSPQFEIFEGRGCRNNRRASPRSHGRNISPDWTIVGLKNEEIMELVCVIFLCFRTGIFRIRAIEETYKSNSLTCTWRLTKCPILLPASRNVYKLKKLTLNNVDMVKHQDIWIWRKIKKAKVA